MQFYVISPFCIIDTCTKQPVKQDSRDLCPAMRCRRLQTAKSPPSQGQGGCTCLCRYRSLLNQFQVLYMVELFAETIGAVVVSNLKEM